MMTFSKRCTKEILRDPINLVFGLVFYPFKWAFKKIRRFTGKTFRKIKGKRENIKNKSKFLLKVHKHLLYNLSVKMVKNGVSEEKEV